MTRNQRLLVILGLAISAVFLAIAFNGLQLSDVLESIQSADPLLLLAAAVWYFVSVIVIALRWQYLLRATKLVALRTLFELVCISYMGNNVYPLRGGEMLRVVLLQRSDNVPIASGGTVAIVERVFDGLVMLTFVLVSLVLLDINSAEIRSIALIAAPIFILALVVFFALAFKPKLLHQLLTLVSRFLPERLSDLMMKLGEDVIVGLEGLRSPGDLAGTIIASYVSWMLEASVYWIVAFAFNLHTSFAAMLLVIGVVNLAGLIPASPGGFGIFEYVTIVALGAVGYDKTQITAFALTAHLVIWLPVTLLGFYFLIRRGLGLGVVAHADQLEKEVAAP